MVTGSFGANTFGESQIHGPSGLKIELGDFCTYNRKCSALIGFGSTKWNISGKFPKRMKFYVARLGF